MSADETIESRGEMEAFLCEETIGYLGLASEGKSYVVPLNYAYTDGRILFHCALEGKKLDCIRDNPDVCFAVGRQTGEVRRHAEGDPCHVDSDSVICYGRARVIDDLQERQSLLDEFNRSYRPDADGITRDAAAKCGAVEIVVSEMTGRRERDRTRTYWRYSFAV